MTTEPDGFSTAETLGGEPPRRRFPRSLLLAGATALVVMTGAGVATAAVLSTPPSGSPTPTPTPTPTATGSASPTDAPADKQRGRAWGWGGHRMGVGIHGEFVVPDGEGKYVTIATQYGEVTAVDQDSVTVKSEDGYTREYAVNADTRINRGDAGLDTVKAGQKVSVRATVEGGTATAVAIHDTEARPRAWHERGDRIKRGEQGGPGEKGERGGPHGWGDWRDRGPHQDDRRPDQDDRGSDEPPASPTPTS
ncbi:hypothetical protein [Nonomuraea sp. NPDC048826]|uniref:hypothetical protein n=1 Tax=Nonomuraea sp. NPDC048826 TaxID=3364347 RepID=UPI00371C3818